MQMICLHTSEIYNIHNLFKLLEDFGETSKSQLNRDQTKILPCGTLKGTPNIHGLPAFSERLKVGINQNETKDLRLNWNW